MKIVTYITMKSGFIKTLSLPLLIAIAMLSSCGMKTAYYQKQVPIPGAKWQAKFMPDFKIEITDTAAFYNPFFLIRHDEAYPNSNIWIKLKIKGPGEKTFTDGPRLDVPLTDVNGVWLGKGMGGIWEHKVAIGLKALPIFKKPGVYEIKIEQLMRVDPLPSVLNVGLTVEMVKQ